MANNNYRSTVFGRKCYRVNVDLINKIKHIIQRRAGDDFEIRLKLDNGDSVTVAETQEFQEYIVIDAQPIFEIDIIYRQYQANDIRSITINFERSITTGPIRISVEGAPDAVNAVKNDLYQLIDTAATGYSYMNYTGNVLAVVAVWLLTACVSLIVSAYEISSFSNDFRHEYTNIFSGVFIFALVGNAMILLHIREWLFPALIFEIGRGIIQNERRAAARKIVFLTVGLGTIVSLFSSRLYDLIK